MTRAFTIIELLVVVGIIIVLIAVLVPALSGAKDAAVRAQCTNNTRTIGQALAQYGIEHSNALPRYNTNGEADSYDMRANGTPANLGVLIAAEMIAASSSLGKVMHCPTHDNSASGGHCMDVDHGGGRGASWWTDQAYTGRIIISYQYRQASWVKQGKGSFKLNTVPTATVTVADLIDMRWRGQGGKFGHAEGYNRSFADGSAAWFDDPPEVGEIQKIVTNNNTNDGRADGRHDNGSGGPGAQDEAAYQYMAVDRK